MKTKLYRMSTIIVMVCFATILALPAFPGRAEGAVKLNVLSSPDNADALIEIAQLFMQENPDITIEVSPVSWDVLYPQILADIISKTGAFDVTTWDLMTAGSIAKGMLDLEKFGKEHPDLVDPNFDVEDFIPTAFHVYGLWEGKNIGYPFYGATMFLFYRKDYFEDEKLKAAFKEKYGRELVPPATWEEALDVTKFFTKSENPDSPTEYGITVMFARTHTLFYMYINWFAQLRRSEAGIAKFGEVSLDWGDLFTADHQPAFNSEEGVKAVEMMMEIMQYSPDPLGSDYGETFEAFGQGTAAMCPSWTAVLSGWKDLPEVSPVDEKVGVAVIPGGHPVSGGWGLGINDASKHKEEAFRFVQFATSQQSDKLQWMKYRIGPTRRSVLSDPEMLADSPWMAGVYEESLENASHRPRIPEEPKIEDIMVGTLSEILLGNKPDIAAALDELAAEWNKILGQE
jgi:ABC-type glycerol-3-phosphate transport system substrate-binding protein